MIQGKYRPVVASVAVLFSTGALSSLLAGVEPARAVGWGAVATVVTVAMSVAVELASRLFRDSDDD